MNDILYESCVATADDAENMWATNWFGETFTPLVSHHLTRMRIVLSRYGSTMETGPGAVTLIVRPTMGGIPIGAVSDLCSATINGNLLPAGGKVYQEFVFKTQPLLIAGTTYVWIPHSAAAYPNCCTIRAVKDAGSVYPRGAEWNSQFKGEPPWVRTSAYDLTYWEEYGTPAPLPPASIENLIDILRADSDFLAGLKRGLAKWQKG